MLSKSLLLFREIAHSNLDRLIYVTSAPCTIPDATYMYIPCMPADTSTRDAVLYLYLQFGFSCAVPVPRDSFLSPRANNGG